MQAFYAARSANPVCRTWQRFVTDTAGRLAAKTDAKALGVGAGPDLDFPVRQDPPLA